MSPKSNTTVLQGLIILLTVLLLALGVYTLIFHKQVNNNKAQFEQEKQILKQELTAEIAKYKSVVKEKEALVKDLEGAMASLDSIKNAITKETISQSDIFLYKSEIQRLKNERIFFVRRNDSLERANENLAALQEKTRVALDSIEKQKDALKAQNRVLQENLAKASKLTASNLILRGVIQRNSGKLVRTQNAKRTEMINVVYEVNENPLAETADLPFYTQVINEAGEFTGIIREVVFPDGTVITYNTLTIVPYKKKKFTVSELVLPFQRFDSGTYTINVYLGSRLMLSDQLILK